MRSPTTWHRTLLICALLSAATFAVFWPVFRHDFIHYDDQDYVTHNPHVADGLSWVSAAWAFKAGHAGNWHPLTWLSHMLDVQLFGLNPGWHHLTSVWFHAANAVLLFLLLQRMTRATGRSAFVAALFALHPLHVESVAWIAERKDVLSTFFFLLTLWAYAEYAEGGRQRAEGGRQNVGDAMQKAVSSATHRAPGTTKHAPRFTLHAPRFYLLALLFFACGLMSKPMLVTLPFVLVLLDFWPLGRLGLKPQASSLRTLVLEKVPFLALTLASCIITFVVQAQAGATVTLNALPIRWRVSNALLSYVVYLRQMVWPTDLAILYPLPGIESPHNPWRTGQLAAAALLLLSISAVAVWRLRRQPWLATGWFWYFGTLVPVIGLIQVGEQARADRYTYVPSIGIFICVIWGAGELLGSIRGRRRAVQRQDSGLAYAGGGDQRSWGWVLAGAAGLLALAACAAATRNQLRYWQDDVPLFERALAISPRDNAAAHLVLGRACMRRGNYELALDHFRSAAKANPNYPGLHYNLGGTLMAMGKPNQAAEEYQAALRLNSGNLSAREALARVLLALGRHEEARAQYAELGRIAPGSPLPFFGQGSVLLAQGRAAAAETNFVAALRVRPDYAEALTGLAEALAVQNRFTDAEARFREALHLCPTNVQTQIRLGRMLLLLGRDTEASECFSKALELAPDLPARNVEAARGDVSEGRYQAAVERLSTVLQLLPDHAQALNDLAWIRATAPLGQVRNGAEAVRLAERACRLSGGKEARFLGTLDAAYAESGRFEDAIHTGEKARALAAGAGDEALVQAAEQRLALYRQHQPFRQ